MTTTQGTREMQTPVGRVLLVATEQGLTHLAFLDEKGERVHGSGELAGDASAEANRALDKAEAQLAGYFRGERQVFDLPLAPNGTAFQREVWDALLDIPYGQTTSYGQLAREIDRADAVRAVGTANGANPIAVIIPVTGSSEPMAA